MLITLMPPRPTLKFLNGWGWGFNRCSLMLPAGYLANTPMSSRQSQRCGEDTIHLCEKCQVAVNQESVDEQKVCPTCGNKKLTEKRPLKWVIFLKLKPD